ncbi:MAG TPA: DUF167 domain-containing protein [Ktedonobacteraceae bacterium]|nr:DUF167 domain-containing protein [Ktedonobacteraceae bacterium]
MRLTVRVIPRSNRNAIEWEKGMLRVRLTAPPVDGAANDALIALLAQRLGLPRRSISIVHGATARQKIVEIVGMTEEAVEQKLNPNQR